MQTKEPFLIEPWLAEFVVQNVSVWIGCRDVHNRPSGVRGAACKVSVDQTALIVFVAEERAQMILDTLQSNGTIAVVVSQPSTHRTYQFKGKDARVVPFHADDLPKVVNGQKTLINELVSLGYTETFSAAITRDPANNYIAIQFTPFAVFDQTPGNSAGKKL